MVTKILALTGASGSGKTSLAEYLIENYPDIFHKTIQVTTRSPRATETAKPQYIHLNLDQYISMDNGKALCAKTVVNCNMYGTLLSSIIANKFNIIIVDIMGLNNLIKDCAYHNISLEIGYLDNRAITEVRAEGRDIEKEKNSLTNYFQNNLTTLHEMIYEGTPKEELLQIYSENLIKIFMKA